MERKSKSYYRRNAKKRARRKKIKKVLCIGLVLLLVICLAYAGVKFLKKDNTETVQENISEEIRITNSEKTESEYNIVLLGEPNVTIKLGEVFQDPGTVVKDKEGNVVNMTIEVQQEELITSGEHKVIYKVTDENGKEAMAERIVNVTPNTEYETTGLPICMYHYVYDASNPPTAIDSNFIEVSVLEEELRYLHEEGYYFPTWNEVREYINGERILPEKSIVLSFDDSPHYIDLAIPLFEQYQTPATSFVITSYYTSYEMLHAYKNDYLYLESHSHNMHRGGGSGAHGGIFPSLGYEDAMADLHTSIELCGSNDAFAYPFGDYTAECEQILSDAGFQCAVTTEVGQCYPGDNPYELKRIRMLGEQSLSEFKSKIQ